MSTATNHKPKPFDLIELTAPIGGYPAGSRGTLVIEGIGHAEVNFAWNDRGPRTVGREHLLVVPTRSMKLIQSRSLDAALSAQRRDRERR
jgi:hypothetical protein